MFELHQLEQLITVAECGTLSAAAEKLHLSQPALSRSMQKLEAELQVPLFTRHKNKIELNENAEMAVDYARKILWQSQDMIDHLRAFDLSRRTIRVGSCAPMPLWEILPALSSLYPAMTISSEMKEEEKLLQGVLDGTYQFIFLPFEVKEDGIRCRRYMEEHLFFSLPPAHALSGSKKLTAGNNIVPADHKFFRIIMNINYGIDRNGENVRHTPSSALARTISGSSSENSFRNSSPVRFSFS